MQRMLSPKAAAALSAPKPQARSRADACSSNSLASSLLHTSRGSAPNISPSLFRQWFQCDGFSCSGGLSCCVEDLHHDHVGVQGSEVTFGRELFADDGGEVVQ